MATLLIAPTGVWRKRDLSFCWFGDFFGSPNKSNKKESTIQLSWFLPLVLQSLDFRGVSIVGLVKTVQTRTGQLMAVRIFCIYMTVQ